MPSALVSELAVKRKTHARVFIIESVRIPLFSHVNVSSAIPVRRDASLQLAAGIVVSRQHAEHPIGMHGRLDHALNGNGFAFEFR